MAYFQHLTPLVSGTTVRAAPLNTIFDGIQTGFEKLPVQELSESGFASTVFIFDGTTPDHAINRRQLQDWPTFSIPQVDGGANRLVNLLDPVGDQDAATKIWVINQTAGIVTAAEAARDAAIAAQVAAAASEAGVTADALVASNAASAASVSEANSAASAVTASNAVISIGSSESNAAASALSASNSAIATSADEALTNADAIATAADKVSTNADAASASADAISAGSDATAAGNSQVAAAGSASSASTSASNASASEALSEDWANKAEDSLVDATQFSAFHWAQKAQNFAGGVVNIADVVGLQASLDSKSALSGAAFTGPVTSTSTFDGRNLGADGTKLDGISSGANNYSHPSHTGRTISVDSGVLSGAVVISDLSVNLTSDASGHVTVGNAALSTRTLTAANIGALASGAKAVDSNLLDGLDSLNFARLGTTNPSSNYFYTTRSSASSAVYVRQGSTGLLAHFFQSSSVDATSGSSFVSFTNNGSISLSGAVDGRNVATDGAKLDGIASNANNYTHPSYSTTNINTSGATIVDLITTDSQGHISAMSTRVLTLANLGYTGASNANNYTLPTASAATLGGIRVGSNLSISSGVLSAVDTDTIYTHPTLAVTNLNTTGAEVVDQISTDSTGHVSLLSKRTLTPGDIGASTSSHQHTTITPVDESSDTLCYPAFFNNSTGNQAVKTGTNLTFNSSTGELTATILNSSDMRLKTLIDFDYPEGFIDTIKYDFKDKSAGINQYGYSAQQVQKTMPQAVGKGHDGMLSLNYTMIHTVKIKELEDELHEIKTILNDNFGLNL